MTTRPPARPRSSPIPRSKSFLKKQEKNGAFPAKPPEKTLGLRRSFARAVATLRALEKMAEFGLGKAHPAVARAAETVVLVAGRRRRHRRSRARRDARVADARGRDPLSGLGAVGAVPRRLRRRTRASSKGFRFLLANRQADGGWAWRGVRTDSAARPSSHLVTGHGAAGVRRLGDAPDLARGAPRRRAARDPLPAARPLSRPQGGQLLGAARRAALLHRRARRARLRDRRRPRQGELGRAHRRGLRARPPERRRALVPGRAARASSPAPSRRCRAPRTASPRAG